MRLAMTLTTIDDPTFLALKAELQGYPRQCGYYLVDVVSIQDLRARSVPPEELLEQVFQHFDDQDWPPAEERPTDQAWADYAATQAQARAFAIDALLGGSQVGHTAATIPNDTATALWERFESLFPEPRTYYVGMGFGDPKFVFQHGAAIVAGDLAGLVWVVESD
jgi:hypothetical protein